MLRSTLEVLLIPQEVLQTQETPRSRRNFKIQDQAETRRFQNYKNFKTQNYKSFKTQNYKSFKTQNYKSYKTQNYKSFKTPESQVLQDSELLHKSLNNSS